MSASARQCEPAAREVADNVEIEHLWHEVTDSGVHPRVALRVLVVRALRLTGGDGCAIALPDTADNGRIKCLASRGSAPPVGVVLDVSTGLSGHCARTGVPVVCNDTAADPRVDPEACRALNLKSALIVPVKEGRAVVGLVEVFASRVAAFDAEHVRFMEQIAEIAATIRTLLTDHESAQPKVGDEQTGLAASADEPAPGPEPAAAADVGIESCVSPLGGEASDAGVAPVDLDGMDVDAVDVDLVHFDDEVRHVDDEAPHLDDKRQAMRLALLSLATLGAIAIAVGFYIAMNPAHRPLSGSAASKPAVVRTTALEELPETDITVGNNSASKRNEAARRGRDARSAASPQSPETSSVEAAAGDTSAVVLSPPAPISTGNVPEEVSPPALNISDSIATMSEATPPAALPTLSSPARIEPSLPARRPEHVRPARLLRKIDPIYPPAAFAAAISGTVVLQARIAADGRVEAVDVLRGTGVFTPAAVNAVRSWKYQPAEVDGRPVESTVVVTINFSR